MTDQVNVSTGHVGTALENARTFRHGAHSLGWVVPNTETILADVRDELAVGPYNAFNATHTTNSLTVTIGSGEAFVGGVPLARDTATQITLGENVDAETIYVGWAVQATDRIVIGTAADFTPEDPRLPLWEFTTTASGVSGATDVREIDPIIDVQNRRYEGGTGAAVDRARSSDKIDGVTIGNLLRTDQDDTVGSRTAWTARGQLSGALGQGNGEIHRYGSASSDMTFSMQGGHGRVMWAWNAYYDNTNGTWRSIEPDELHACIAFVNNDPGYGTKPASLVFGTSAKNSDPGEPVEWNWVGVDQFGDLDMGGNQVKNFSIEARDDRPADPDIGRVIYRTDQDDNLTY